MSDDAETPQPAPTPSTLGEAQEKHVRVRVPAAWHEALTEATREMGISLSDLTRMLFRQFLRNRYTEEEREALSGGDK